MPSACHSCLGLAWEAQPWLVSGVVPGCWLLAGSFGFHTDLVAGDGFATGIVKFRALFRVRGDSHSSGLGPHALVWKEV